eukprot:CAMPEP_0178745940 /NCGR_PEP_ID=MMETSP0744-20121128/7555_1 /TAXON_ID=913974 /ORGANISM="Nitzschia punctata, Strain CCMP561" /LENGTH=297 /DNA_ID=CAMNT_0020399141 /DNA_START=209 /DNA_END=1102 /DNA_ORIENTATION=-
MRKTNENVLLVLLLGVHVACFSVAFSPAARRQVQVGGLSTKTTITASSTRIFLSQWDDDEEEVATSRASFDEAGESLKKQEDDEKMDAVGDFDANPSYSDQTVEQIREAIKRRADSLGIERSVEDVEAKKEAEERARAQMEAKLSGSGQLEQLLDLSKISSQGPREIDPNLPSMFYEPESEMTEQQIKEADPVGQMPYIEQFFNVIGRAEWPSFFDATKDVFVLLTSVVVSASLIVGWDSIVRYGLTKYDYLPSEEEVQRGKAERLQEAGLTAADLEANDGAFMEGVKSFLNKDPDL